MAKITLTEALQEIKTINSRLLKKRSAIQQYIARDSKIIDPLQKDGGSEKYIEQERQAIRDLERRIVAIRTAIQRANLHSELTLAGITQSVAEWLTWRREISEQSRAFLTAMSTSIATTRAALQRRDRAVGIVQVNDAGGEVPQLTVNVDEKKLVGEQEQMEQVLGELDGKLSLFNATCMVDI